MSVMEQLVGMSDVIGVRNMLRDINDYRDALPKTSKGHVRYTHEQAIGFQKLQFQYQRATTLALIDMEKDVVSFHPRPNHYLRSAPMAALHCGGDVAH